MANFAGLHLHSVEPRLNISICLEERNFGAEFVDLLFQVSHLSGVFALGSIAGILLIRATQKSTHGFARQIRYAACAAGNTDPPQSGELLFGHSDADDPRPRSQDSHIELRNGIKISVQRWRLRGWVISRMIRGDERRLGKPKFFPGRNQLLPRKALLQASPLSVPSRSTNRSSSSEKTHLRSGPITHLVTKGMSASPFCAAYQCQAWIRERDYLNTRIPGKQGKRMTNEYIS